VIFQLSVFVCVTKISINLCGSFLERLFLGWVVSQTYEYHNFSPR
jgi:hypothetical protein